MLGGLLLIRLRLGDSYRLKRCRVTTGTPFSGYPLRASRMRISVPRLTATAAGERHPERYHPEGRRTVGRRRSSVKRMAELFCGGVSGTPVLSVVLGLWTVRSMLLKIRLVKFLGNFVACVLYV